MKVCQWILPVVLLVPFAQFATAQSDDWGILKQLPQGQKIKLVTADRKSHQGAVQSVTDDSIQLKNGFTAARQDVRRVLIGHGGHRARNALIGAGVGAGTGAAVGAAFDSQSGFWRNNGVKVGVPAFAGVGLLVGVALPSRGHWRELYRSR